MVECDEATVYILCIEKCRRMGTQKEDLVLIVGEALNLSERISFPFRHPTYLSRGTPQPQEEDQKQTRSHEGDQEGDQEGVNEKTSQKRRLNNAPG